MANSSSTFLQRRAQILGTSKASKSVIQPIATNSFQQRRQQILSTISKPKAPVKKAVIKDKPIKKQLIVKPEDKKKIQEAKDAVSNATPTAQLYNLAKSVFVETPARAAASITQTALKRPSVIKPETPVEKFLFGKEPIKDVPTQKNDIAKFLKKELKYTDKQANDSAALALAGSLTLDLMPGVNKAKFLVNPKKIAQLRKVLRPDDVKLLGRFAELVETGKAKGNLGELGKTVQSLTENIFGKKAAGLSNKQIKNLWDLHLTKVGQQENKAGLGLSMQIVGDAKTTFEDASKHLTERIGEGTKSSFFKDFGLKTKNFKAVLKEKLVDSFSPIEDTINTIERKGKFKLSATEDPRLLRNRVLGSVDIAKQALKQNVEPILKQIGSKNLDEFDRYLVARHSLDLTEKGITTGVDPVKAKTYIDALGPKYEEAAKQVTEYTQKMLKYVADNGLISKETYNNLKNKYPNYVPMNRVMDELDDLAMTTAIPNKSIGSLSKQTIVKTIKGSERQIESPLASIVEKTMRAVDEVERNRVAKSLASLRKVKGFEELIQEVPQAKGKNVISTFEDGVKKFYEVPKGFAEAAKNLNVEHMDILTRILSLPVRLARLGITGVNIPFIATNVVRDQLFSILTSKKALKTSAIANPYNFIKSFLDVAGNKGAYDDFLASGGGSSNFFSVGKDAARVNVKDLARGNKSKIVRTITNPFKMLSLIEDTVGVSEQTTRVQQFRGTRQALKEGGKVDPFANPTEAGLKAVQAGRENTVDFAKKGAIGKVLNSVFIYLNAGIQGSRTALRSFKTDPIGTSAKLAATVYTPIAITTLWNTATPERKQAYMDIPDYEKANNLIILPANPVLNDKRR